MGRRWMQDAPNKDRWRDRAPTAAALYVRVLRIVRPHQPPRLHLQIDLDDDDEPPDLAAGDLVPTTPPYNN